MKSKMANKFKMDRAVHDYVHRNKAKTTSLPLFWEYFGLFSSNLVEIQRIAEFLAANRTGIYENKLQLRRDLIAKALDISRKTGAYARLVKNVVLATEVHFTESALMRSTESLLKDRAALILDKARENFEALTSFGITEEELKTFQTAIDLYNTSIPQTRLGITERKQAASELERLFRLNDELLEKMDNLMEFVRNSQPAFYEGYFSNRKVIETGRTSLSLKAMVADAVTKQRIKGVKVSFIPENGKMKSSSGKVETALVKITSQKGMFRIKSLAAGMYNAVISKPGYQEKIVPVSVSGSEMTELIVELERM